MTIKLRLISDEEDNFVRDIAINSENTFLDLHNFIQNNLGYKNEEMASFFETDNDWNKETEIPMIDMGEDEVIIMAEAKLADYISEKKQRLLYTFDLFNDRSLYIETYEVNNEVCDNTTILNSIGDAPKAVCMNNIINDDKVNSTSFDMDDFNDEFNDDSNDDSMITYSDNLDEF